MFKAKPLYLSKPDPVQVGLAHVLRALNTCVNEDAVADLMQKESIKGQKSEPKYCPVSRFFNKKMPGQTFSVGAYTVRPHSEAETSQPYFLPIPVRQFIGAFDFGKYPDLILE